MSTQTGRFRRIMSRWTATDTEIDAEDLSEQSRDTGATPCSQAGARQQICVSGRLQSVVFTPRTNLPTLEAELYDGTGTVTLIWLGRHRIPGIEPGARLWVRGRVASLEGRQVIYNPFYEIKCGAR